MASVFNFCEDNGAASSGHGTTRHQSSNPPANMNWKNADDCSATDASGTAYSASPVVAGTNSYSKYIYGQWTGTYNQILNCKWSARTSPAGALATGLHLKGIVTSTYAQPATSANAALTTDYTSAPVAVASGASVNLGADPSTAASATLSSGGGFSQYLVTQLQTDNTAAAGDMSAITATVQWDEN